MDWLEPLRKDTERIRQDTERIRQDTERIRQETQAIRKANQKLKQLLKMKVTENELNDVFKKHGGCFMSAVTEILSRFDIQVTKGPSDLEAALSGDREAARRVLVEMGIIDKEGNLTENYRPLQES